MNRYLCIVYVSEGKNKLLLQSIHEFIKISMKSTYFAHTFVDYAYNRTSFYFIGTHIIQDLLLFCSQVFNRYYFIDND